MSESVGRSHPSVVHGGSAATVRSDLTDATAGATSIGAGCEA